MRRIVTCIVILFLNLQTKAEEYPVYTIPKSLLKNANAVIRQQEEEIEIHSLNKVTIKEHYVITILNEAGERLAFWTGTYSKLNSVSRIDGTLYDEMGKKIRELKKSEIKDVNVNSEGQMIDDTRLKYHNFYHKTFPYTVEYSCERTANHTMYLPDWSPVAARNISVIQSSYTVITDDNYELRTKSYNLNQTPVEKNIGKKKQRTWEIKNIPALPNEYAAPPIHELAPYLAVAPSNFEIENYSGSFNTWGDYGKFINTLNNGRDELPGNLKEKVRQITNGISSTSEKVKLLYRFLQQNTHYIGIQLGIGGYQPFSAMNVAKTGYGDCKALSNYMVALLREAGIKANYVLARAGENNQAIPSDFPASNFNHVICAVPLEKDTIWLECTSQTVSPGYMGSFTGDRDVLMMTEEGGKLVHTPVYKKSENTITSNFQATLDMEGSLGVKMNNNYRAVCGDMLHAIINDYSKEDQLKYLKKNIELGHYDIVDFSYEESGDKLPVINEKIQLKASNYAQFTGKRLFITPNILNKWSERLPVDTARIYPIELKEEKTEKDTITIQVPAGYSAESIPRPELLKTPFGIYSTSTTFKDNQIFYIRQLELNKGKFKATEYNDLVKFYELMYKADRAIVVLVKAPSTHLPNELIVQ